MTLDVQLLRTSFATVVEREPQLTARFYDRLFADHPALEPLFDGAKRRAQEEMLAKALMSVLEHIEDAPWLERELGAMGERHRGYGVTEVMYGQVGGSLLATLADVAGADWTPELEAQWSAAFGVIAGLMQQGQRAHAH